MTFKFDNSMLPYLFMLLISTATTVIIDISFVIAWQKSLWFYICLFGIGGISATVLQVIGWYFMLPVLFYRRTTYDF